MMELVMARSHEIPGPRPGDDAPFDLEETTLPRPALPGEVAVLPTVHEVHDRLAADLVMHAENCVRQFGDFHLALSGGPVLEPFYQRLMYDPDCRRLPWRRTHLWFVDEHCLPFEDERSCFRLISETLGDHADIPPEQFHPIFAESETAIHDYETQIREALAWREKGQDRLDCALLTMSADGGTAGLAPFSPLVGDEGNGRPAALMGRTIDRDGGHARVTMTLPFLNAARFVAVLILGDAMAETVMRLTEADESVDAMPVRGLAPINGELRWYLDAAACGVEVEE
jgi:6-phosphogluconolactonase